MSDFEYVVMTPLPMRGSAGIRFLNELTDDICSTGRKAHRLYAISTNIGLAVSSDGKTFLKSEPDLIRNLVGNPDKLIVIHGENQDCKNFMGLNVARYYLNRIGALRKVGVPREGEFKITWEPEFCDGYDFHLRTSMLRYPPQKAFAIPMQDTFLRTFNLTYVGKAIKTSPNITRLPDTLELTRNWPNNDEEYFFLLKNTKHLYTYDTVTSVLDDAITLGALPVSMTDRIENVTLTGCVAHIEDDLEYAKLTFPAARLKYLEGQVRMAAEYKANLDRCCLAMEKFFG